MSRESYTSARQRLERAFVDANLAPIHFMTQKAIKREAVKVFAAEHAGVQVQEVLDGGRYEEVYHEPESNDALAVARHKAGFLKMMLGKEGKVNATTAGADSVFSFYEPTGEQFWHTLKRNGGELSQEALANEFFRLQLLLAASENDRNARITMRWQVAAYVMNGTNTGFDEHVIVETKPIDDELLRYFFAQAVNSGLIYKANTHLPMIEMLKEAGTVTSVAVVTPKTEQQGKTYAQLRRRPTQDLLLGIERDVHTTFPKLSQEV